MDAIEIAEFGYGLATQIYDHNLIGLIGRHPDVIVVIQNDSVGTRLQGWREARSGRIAARPRAAEAAASQRVFTLRRMLLELLQNTDSPMSITAICNRVTENGGESATASLAETDAVLKNLEPVLSVRADWQEYLDPAAAKRWES